MDDDEVFVLLAGLVLTVVSAARWYVQLARFRPPAATAAPLDVTPPLCLLGLWAVLRTLADPQVRDHGPYVALFLAVGGALLGGTAVSLPVVLGIGVRDDVVERRNGPAAAVVAGAMIAATTVFAGANVGVGATIWTTLGPAGLGLVTLAVLATTHAAAGGLTESITVDRDPAAAARAVGLHVAVAAVLARAVAGDFVSADATVADLARRGWPAAVVVGVAVVVDRWHMHRPWAARRRVVPAVISAVGYVVAAVASALLV